MRQRIPFLADLTPSNAPHGRSDLVEVQVKKHNDRAICLAMGENCERTPHAEEMPGFCSRPWLSQIVAKMKFGLSSIGERTCIPY